MSDKIQVTPPQLEDWDLADIQRAHDVLDSLESAEALAEIRGPN